jgi:hypothetical protein
MAKQPRRPTRSKRGRREAEQPDRDMPELAREIAEAGPPLGQRRRLASRQGTVVTTVALPADLYHALTRLAFVRRWTLAECVRVSVAAWLRRQPERAR